VNDAAELVDCGRDIVHHVGVIAEDGWSMDDVAKANLAVKLFRRPALAFRAIFEGWNLDRIARELHQ
jgi:hypothetical protein